MSVCVSDLGLSSLLEDSLEHAASHRLRKQLSRFLGLMESGALNAFLFGKGRSFSSMSREERASLLYYKAVSPFPLVLAGRRCERSVRPSIKAHPGGGSG